MGSLSQLFIFCVLAAGPTGDGQLSLTPQQGVLVLRNGFVLSGRVTRVGDYYLVDFDQRGEVRLAAQKVARFCATLDDAYLAKRNELQRGDVQAHLDLASWCLRVGLINRAADQMLAALAIDPHHPEIDIIERRLVMTVEAEQSRATPVRFHGSIRSDERPIDPVPVSAPTVEWFTAKVQPILLNRCAANACHGTRSNQAFKLVRPLSGQSVTARATQRNLRAVLEQVNEDEPEQSPLVRVPLSEHGGTGRLFTAADRSAYDQLLVWVRHASQEIKAPSRSQGGDSNSAQRPGVPPGQATSSGQGNSTGRPINIDPYDPGPFNRRYALNREDSLKSR